MKTASIGILLTVNARAAAFALNATKWDARRFSWNVKYPSGVDPQLYARAKGAYLAAARIAAAIGAPNLRTIYAGEGRWLRPDGSEMIRPRILTVREFAEESAGLRLIDLHPDDAIELARQTPWSADDWYLACQS